MSTPLVSVTETKPYEYKALPLIYNDPKILNPFILSHVILNKRVKEGNCTEPQRLKLKEELVPILAHKKSMINALDISIAGGLFAKGMYGVPNEFIPIIRGVSKYNTMHLSMSHYDHNHISLNYFCHT